MLLYMLLVKQLQLIYQKIGGANVKFYSTDAINNGAMNFVIWDINLLKKKASVKYFELHEAEN